MSQEPGRGLPASRPTLAPSGTRLIASTPQAMPTSMAPAAIEAGDQVRGLLRRAALGVEGEAAGLVGQPGVQPGASG